MSQVNHVEAIPGIEVKPTSTLSADAHCSYGPQECDECAALQPDGVELSVADYNSLVSSREALVKALSRMVEHFPCGHEGPYVEMCAGCNSRAALAAAAA